MTEVLFLNGMFVWVERLGKNTIRKHHLSSSVSLQFKEVFFLPPYILSLGKKNKYKVI